jgi:hypothetical protein
VQIRIGIRKFVTVFVLLDVDLAHNIRQVFYSSKASDNLDGRHVHLEDQVAAEQVRSIAQWSFAAVHGQDNLPDAWRFCRQWSEISESFEEMLIVWGDVEGTNVITERTVFDHSI